jgi:hypothetical protein
MGCRRREDRRQDPIPPLKKVTTMAKKPDLQAEASKVWRLLTAPLRTRPVFLMPGAPKCGSSSLFDALLLHPRVRRGLFKEPASLIRHPGSDLRLRMNFPLARPLVPWVCGDASMEYWFHPSVPARAARKMPDARLIFIFREPVARAWSEYRMFRKSGNDDADFSRTVSNAVKWLSDPSAGDLCHSALRQWKNPLRYVRCGMYADLLREWWRHFSREQSLVLFLEEVSVSPQEHLARAWHHLGLESVPVPSMPHAREGGGGEDMPGEAKRILENFYGPRDADLMNLLGRELPW